MKMLNFVQPLIK